MILRLFTWGFRATITGLLYQLMRFGVRRHFNQRIRHAQRQRALHHPELDAPYYHGDESLYAGPDTPTPLMPSPRG